MPTDPDTAYIKATYCGDAPLNLACYGVVEPEEQICITEEQYQVIKDDERFKDFFTDPLLDSGGGGGSSEPPIDPEPTVLPNKSEHAHEFKPGDSPVSIASLIARSGSNTNVYSIQVLVLDPDSNLELPAGSGNSVNLTSPGESQEWCGCANPDATLQDAEDFGLTINSGCVRVSWVSYTP